MMPWDVEELWNLMQAGFKFDMMVWNRKVIQINRVWDVNNLQYMYDCIGEDGKHYLRYYTANIYAAMIMED